MMLFRRFSKYLRHQRPALFVGSSAVLLNTAMDLLKPWPLKVVVDNVIQNHPVRRSGLGGWILGPAHSRVGLLNWAIVLAILAVLLGALFEYFGKRTLGMVGQRMMVALRRDVFSLLQRRSLAFHDRQQVGDLVTRVTADSDKMQEALVQTLTMLLPAIATMLAMGTIMAFLDWRVTLLALSTTPALFVLTFGLGRSMRKAAKAARRHDGAVAAMATETLSSIRVVQAFTREDDEDRRFGGYAMASSMAGRKALEMEARYGPLVDVVNVIGSAIMIWFGAHRVIAGQMSVGELLIFLAYLGSFYKPLKQMSKLTQQVAKGTASAERIAEILEEDIEVRDSPNAVPLGRPAGSLRFETVTFGYEPDRPVLRDVSFKIAAGEVVALVGPTGAGKSTLVGLIPRFVDPWRGRVLIDDHDARNYTVRSLRDQVAMVLQDPILFRGTIYDNIAYGAPNATRDEVMAAAKAANVDEFVSVLPDGYSSAVGERGVTLSGGQRQRISIARALVRNAPIIILDEPTSGLDSSSEKLVMDALEELMKGRTTIIIAHRLSTARRADRIFVISGGQIVEEGTHAALLAADGLYRRFHNVQFDAGEGSEPDVVVDLTDKALAQTDPAPVKTEPPLADPAMFGSGRPALNAGNPFAMPAVTNGRETPRLLDASKAPNGNGAEGSNGNGDRLPRDERIPGLVAIAEEGIEAVLARGFLTEPVSDVRLLKCHTGSRCTFAATVGGRRVVVKAYRDDRSADIELLRRLERAGLASGRAPTVAPYVTHVPELNLVVTGWLTGPRASDLVRTGRGELAGERGAEWLHMIAKAGIDYGERYGAAHALHEAARYGRDIAAADAELGWRALACADALAIRAPDASRIGLVHGSFSISHVIDMGDGPGVIDWDGFAQGPLELDAGRFLARLAEYAGRSAGGSAVVAAETFRRETGDLLSEDALAWYTALALLKLAKYRARKGLAGWRERVSVLLDEASRTMAVPR
jgi:ATP-binding cassette, subfamily B, bacterial